MYQQKTLLPARKREHATTTTTLPPSTTDYEPLTPQSINQQHSTDGKNKSVLEANNVCHVIPRDVICILMYGHGGLVLDGSVLPVN